MNLVEHAKYELDRILKGCEAKEEYDLQLLVNNNILDIIKLFAEQGHSGTSSAYVIEFLHRLIQYKPIGPLTGEEDEWEISVASDCDIPIYQNKRCPSVFRTGTDNSTAHMIDGKIFSDNGGCSWYTSKNSSIPIEFPFNVPLYSEYVYLDETGTRVLTDEKEIAELREKYKDLYSK